MAPVYKLTKGCLIIVTYGYEEFLEDVKVKIISPSVDESDECGICTLC